MTRTARSQALAFLTREISRCVSGSNPRLPATEHLAAACGVSRVTMWRAVHELVNKGQLTAAPRRGICVSALGQRLPASIHEIDPGAAPSPPERSWQRLQSRLGRGIQSGRPGPGQMLPPFKTIARSYGVTHTTVRRALDALCADGAIEPAGRHYRVCSPTPRQTPTTVVFVSGLEQADWVAAATVRSAQFIQALERQSHGLRFAVRSVSCRQLLSELSAHHDAGHTYVSQDRLSVAGFLVWTTSINPEMSRRLFALLRREGRPVAVLEESSSHREYRSLVASPLYRYFFLGTEPSHGEEVGAYLLRQGHRRVAFFSVYPMQRWVAHRYDGIRGVYSRNGLANSVVLCSPDRPEQNQQMLDSVLSGAGAGATAEALRQLHEFADSVHHSRGPVLRDDPWPQYILRRAIAQRLQPLFRRALTDPAITAWVSVEDSHGLAALDFLAGTPAGRRVSVVSFDNSPESLRGGLTSYDFNLSLIVQRMLHHLLTPPRRVSVDSPLIEHVPGFVVERWSSRAVTVGR